MVTLSPTPFAPSSVVAGLPPLPFPFTQASTNYKEAFALFDKRGNGRIPSSSLGDLLRACGQNPTNGEVDELVRGVKTDRLSPPPPIRLAFPVLSSFLLLD